MTYITLDELKERAEKARERILASGLGESDPEAREKARKKPE